METECITLFSSDVFKVVLGAIIGLAGTLIVTTMTYRLETAKMKANHRASVIKDAQVTAHKYFTRIRGVVVAIENHNKGNNQCDIDTIMKELFKYQDEMLATKSQLKSFGFEHLVESLSLCIEPFESFILESQKENNFASIRTVAVRMNILEDEFLKDVHKAYKKLKL